MMLAAVLVPPSANETSAAWSDVQVAETNFKAAEIPGIESKGCITTKTTVVVDLISVATISWFPAEPIETSVVKYKVVGKADTDTNWTVIDQTNQPTYRFETGLLPGVLGLLNELFERSADVTVGIVAIHEFGGSTWESLPIEIAKVGRNGLIGYECVQ